MHSIFWKIFLSFWLSMVLIIGVAVMSSFRLAADRTEAMDEFDRREVLISAATAFEEGGLSGFKDWVSGSNELPSDQTLYLIDDSGTEALNRKLPSKMQQPRFSKRLRGSGNRRHSVRLNSGRMMQFIAPDGSEYRPVFGAKPPPVFGMLGIPRMALFILTAGMLISAFVCYLLTRYLTRPLAGMVKASHELASGNLSSRVGASAYRGDEIGQLAQQFDAMASRFEHQIDSRQTLFRNISHELRSPLARIKVAVELADRKPDEALLQLQRIEREADNIEHLVSQVLELVRIQQHDSSEAQTIDLIATINRVVDDAEFEGLANNKSVAWQAPSRTVQVMGHPALLHSAIENVIRNAISYTANDTCIELKLTSDNNTVTLKVRDHGPGVAEAELEHILEPFYRSSSSIDIPGSGIGLAITVQGIQIMGGTIGTKNALDGGLIVTITLPLARCAI